MEKIKVYMELPCIENPSYESDFVDAFGYVEVSKTELGKYIIARQFRDNCSPDCGCDKDYYNPAFLMEANIFQEKLEEDADSLRGNIQIFDSMDIAQEKVFEIQRANLHDSNDLIIYQITTDSDDYKWATLIAVAIIRDFNLKTL